MHIWSPDARPVLFPQTSFAMRRFLCLFLFAAALGCNGQPGKINKLDWYDNVLRTGLVDSGLMLRLSDKRSVEWVHGCFVEHTTSGAQAFTGVVKQLSPLTGEEKALLCIHLLENRYCYHLHDTAGKILKLYQKNNAIGEAINSSPESSYIRLRMNHPLEVVFRPGGNFFDLEKDKQDTLIQIIAGNRRNPAKQRYFMEALYSLTASAENGIRIHEAIQRAVSDREVSTYNDSLYEVYTRLKPLYERLEAISTWMEMDRNYDSLKRLFTDIHPIMFYQILSQNPSTVLGSRELSQLKHKAILALVNNAPAYSYYASYRLALLQEMLHSEAYSVRYLQTIMPATAIEKLSKQLSDALTK